MRILVQHGMNPGLVRALDLHWQLLGREDAAVLWRMFELAAFCASHYTPGNVPEFAYWEASGSVWPSPTANPQTPKTPQALWQCMTPGYVHGKFKHALADTATNQGTHQARTSTSTPTPSLRMLLKPTLSLRQHLLTTFSATTISDGKKKHTKQL